MIYEEIDLAVISAIKKMKDGKIEDISAKEVNSVWLFAESCLSEKYNIFRDSEQSERTEWKGQPEL